MIAARRVVAIAVSIWLLGIPVTALAFWSVVFRAPGELADHHLIFYWALWGPTVAFCGAASAGIGGFFLWEFYKWALGDPRKEGRQERIQRLERELNIGR